MPRRKVPSLLLAAALLGAAGPAGALVDIPSSDRSALGFAELASGSGVSRPLDPASLPLDDQPYLEAFYALVVKGAVDPTGERLAAFHDACKRGGLCWEFLLPVLEVSPYYYDGDGAGHRVLHHTSGDTVRDGFNAFLSASGQAAWGAHLGASYELRAQVAEEDARYRTKRLYVKGVWGKWSLKLGRDAERLGPGYHSSLLLDDDALTYDLWRVRTEEPLFLPGSLERIGGFRFSVFNGYLTDGNPGPPDPRYVGSTKAPVEDPGLLGMRASYHPTSWFDLGVSRAILYGGDGRASYTTPEDWWKLFTASDENVEPGDDDTYDNDQYAAVDLTVRVPALNGFGPFKAGKFYWEYAGTDLRATWQGDEVDGLLPLEFVSASYLWGLQLSTAVTDFRLEYADTNDEWYQHNEYRQGYSFRQVPLGHHMGGDARNWYLEVSRYFGPAWQATLSADLESRGRSAVTENRAEWGLGIQARRLEFFGLRWQGSLDALVADVERPLDDPERRDRTEFYIGVGLRVAPWQP